MGLEEMIAERVMHAVTAAIENIKLPAPPPAPAEPDWSILFWTCDPNVRIGMKQLKAGLDKENAWVYRYTGASCPAEDRMPHREGVGGSHVFVVGEVRDWWFERERIVVPGSHAIRKFDQKHNNNRKIA